MFTWLSTGTRRAFKLALAANDEAILLRKAVRELEDRLATLEGQHKTLRGRFYAAGRPAEEGPGDSREQRKAQAFAKAGWAAGQPIKPEKH
jgi:hypothetical protein